MKNNQNLIWIDLEMTGLEPEQDESPTDNQHALPNNRNSIANKQHQSIIIPRPLVWFSHAMPAMH